MYACLINLTHSFFLSFSLTLSPWIFPESKLSRVQTGQFSTTFSNACSAENYEPWILTKFSRAMGVKMGLFL
jgi:hypothetical protein